MADNNNNVFSGFAQGMNEGAGWAAKQTELDLARKKVQQDQEDHAEQKRQFDVGLGKQYLNTIHFAALMPPGKTKTQHLKSLREDSVNSGLNINDSVWAAADDPNYIPQIDKIYQALTGGVAPKDPKMFNDVMGGLIPAMESKDFIANLQKMADNSVTLEKAATDSAAKLKAAQIEADAKKTGAKNLNDARAARQNGTDIRTASSLFKDPNIQRETLKINSASSARTLLDSIASNDLKASKNIRNQLTNLVNITEMGAPGALTDRQNAGINNLYTYAKDLSGWVTSHPNDTIPESYISQLGSEVNALGDRAAKNYKNLTDAAIAGTELTKDEQSADDPEAPASNISKYARARQKQFLNGNGYDHETGERIAVKKQPSPAKEAPKKVATRADAILEGLKAKYKSTEDKKAFRSKPDFQRMTPEQQAYITGGK